MRCSFVRVFLFRSLIGDESAVTVTILDMNALALKMFFNSLNCHASKLLEKVGCKYYSQTLLYGRPIIKGAGRVF